GIIARLLAARNLPGGGAGRHGVERGWQLGPGRSKPMGRATMGVAALLLASAVGSAEKASLIQGTSGASAGSLEVQAGGLVVREGSAGSAFGTVRAGGKRRLSYFVVFKHSFTAGAAADCKEEVSAEDNGGTSKQTVDLDGKKLTVGYEVSYDPKAKKVLA